LVALLKLKASVEYQTRDGKTALNQAAWYGKERIIDLLVEHAADVNMETRDHGITALMKASAAGQCGAIGALIRLGAKIDLESQRGGTALIRAAASGQVGSIQTLVRAGGAVGLETRKDGWTALNKAVGALVELKADVNHESCFGRKTAPMPKTPLIWAAGKGKVKAIAALVEHKAEVNYVDSSGKTALIEASWHAEKEAMDTLMQFGAILNP
jgi:uncharacterized protein